MEKHMVWKDENDNSNLNSYFLSNVCRLCATVSENVVPIFDEKRSIYTKLKKCLPSILVLENDLKPKHLCLTCVSKLDSCFSFVEMSRETDIKYEALLQKKVELATNLRETPANNQETPWIIPIKEENMEKVDSIFHRTEGVSLTRSTERFERLYQQKSAFYQQISSTPATVSTSKNSAYNGTPNGINHSILQNLLTQDTVSSQDMVLLVEVKCKDLLTTSNNAQVNKKDDLPQNVALPSVKMKSSVGEAASLVGQQTKIIDMSGHVRVINLADFDGKFNHFDKISSSFITTDDLTTEKPSNTTNSIVPFLKNFESDVLSFLKLDDSGLENTASADPLEPSSTASIAMPSIPAIMMQTDAKPNNSITNEFRCEVCGKTFTRKNRLNAHVARHSSERPHSCDKCDQRFITRWDLTLHLRIHSGIFSCEFCGKAFPAKGKLERHRRTHTGERPFPCTLCSRAFSEKRNLHNHLKTHVNVGSTATVVGELGYSNSSCCTICGRWLMSTNMTSDPFETRCKSCSSQISLTAVDKSNTSGNTDNLKD